VIVHVAPAAIMLVGVLEIIHATAASPLLKPVPVIVTAVLNGPLLGVRVMVGDRVVMVKTAVPKSPLLPRTLTT